jgi:hypothetical protein
MHTPPAARPAVLLVEGRRAAFTDHVLSRDDVDVVLLRPDCLPLSEAHLRRTAHIPTFTLDTAAPVQDEAARYLRWMKGTKNLLRPYFFCDPDRAPQAATERFAALVDLPHPAGERAGRVPDRTALYECYDRLGIPHAAYRTVRGPDDITAFGNAHGWPLLLKPVDARSRTGARRVESPAALAHLPPPDPAAEWMAQEYVTGRALRLSALVARGQVLDAYLSTKPRPAPRADLDDALDTLDATITYAPGEEIPLDARELAQQLADGLEIPFGALHGTFWLTDDGRFVMGEAAAGLDGCDIPVNHSLAFGFDLLHAVLDTYLDRVPLPRYTRDRAVGDLRLPAVAGRVVHISSAEELLRLPGVIAARLTARPGDVLHPPHPAPAGQVRVEGATADEVEQRMHAVLAHFELKVDQT